MATFADLSINKVGTGYKLTATSGTLTSATSAAFNITAGTAAKLVLTTLPSSTAQSGVTFTQQPVVQLQDANGNPVGQSGTVVIATIASGSAEATVSGPTATTGPSGAATFSGLGISGPTGSYTLSFADSSGVTPVTSGTITLGAGPTSRLVFTVQPEDATAGAVITPAVKVTAQDASGNTATSFTGSVSVAIGTNPSGGTLLATTPKTAVSGVASFDDLRVNKAGTGYTLTATSGTLTSATSSAFNITAGGVSAAQSTVTASPPTIEAGIGTSTITVTARDANDNAISGVTVVLSATGSGNSFTPAATGTTNTSGVMTATFSSTVVEAKTISATIDGLAVSQTATVTVTSGAVSAVQSTVTASPTTIEAGLGASTITVTARDENGNPIEGATVVLAATGAGNIVTQPSDSTNASGVATGTLRSLVAEAKTVSATIDGKPIDQTATVTVTAPPATQLVFTVQPTSAVAGVAITPAVVVTALDAGGNVATGFTGQVEMAIDTDASQNHNAKLGGTMKVNAVAGVATFSNLNINKVGTGYTLAASANGLTSATSTTFNITPGAATQLVFMAEPGNAGMDSTITPAIQVAAVDEFGNTATDFTGDVALTIGTDASATQDATLWGTLPVAAVSGVATFGDLSIDRTGNGYTLLASAPSAPELSLATSLSFEIVLVQLP